MKKLFLFIGIILYCSILNAQLDWTYGLNSNNGSFIRCLTRYANDTILAGTNDGAMISFDNGTSWQSFGLNNKHVSSMFCLDSEVIAMCGWDWLHTTIPPDSTWNYSAWLGEFITYRFKTINDTTYICNITTYESPPLMYTCFPLYFYLWRTFPTSNFQSIRDIECNNIYHKYLLSQEGLFVSYDQGENWDIVEPIEDGFSVYLPDYANIIVCSAWGLYYSYDLGATWLKEDSITGAYKIIDSDDLGYYFLICMSDVYYSDSPYGPWFKTKLGESTGWIYDAIISNSNRIIVAGNPGIYYADLTYLKIIEKDPEISVRISPNPAHDMIRIIFHDPKPENYNFQVFDISGKQLKNSFLNTNSLNNNILYFDVSDLQQGVYFFNLHSKNQNITEKVIVY